MAIGLGRMFGFRFPENFRHPYVADSVQEFWRRWHISLSSWFRDYLYVPLGGNRISSVRTYVNLVIVFFLCGLWHGASWSFVVWGLFHGTFLVLERAGLADWIHRISSPLRHAYLMLVVMVGWVFFRADTLPQATSFLSAMAGFGAANPTPYAVSWYLTPELGLALAAGVVGSMPVVPALVAWRDRIAGRGTSPFLPRALDFGATVALALLLTLSVLQVAARTYNPFIYFRF
jgi:alginate O-acetyltransferase complex protein AlgI